MTKPRPMSNKAAELVKMAQAELTAADHQLEVAKRITNDAERRAAIAEAQSNINRANLALVNARNAEND